MFFFNAHNEPIRSNQKSGESNLFSRYVVPIWCVWLSLVFYFEEQSLTQCCLHAACNTSLLSLYSLSHNECRLHISYVVCLVNVIFYLPAQYARQLSAQAARSCRSYNSSCCAFRDLEKYIHLQTKRQWLHFHLDLWLIPIDQHSLCTALWKIGRGKKWWRVGQYKYFEPEKVKHRLLGKMKTG